MKVSMPSGSAHGWGIAGTYLAEEIAKLPAVEGVTLHCIAGHDFKPFAESAWDRINIGYCFFEHELLAYPFIAQAARYWDHIVAGSSWCERHLRIGGMDRVSTILQGVDSSRFFRTPPRLDDGRFIVFSGGKFEFRKGQDIVIAAMRTFMERHDDVWLSCSWHNQWPLSIRTMEQSRLIDFLWQDIPCMDLLYDTLRRNGLDPQRVLLHSPFDNSRMPLIYAESDIGVFPNRCEGGNNMVMCEYMACGRTVIASDRTGHADVITPDNAFCLASYRPVTARIDNHETGHWLEGDPDELLDLLERAYCERQLVRDKGVQAALDMSRLSWHEAAHRFHDLALTLSLPKLSSNAVLETCIEEAETFFNNGDYGSAEARYRDAIAVAPLHGGLYNNMGTVLDRQGRYREAIGYYGKGLALGPESSEIRVNLAHTLARTGDVEGAVTELRAAVAHDPECLQAWEGLAIHFQQGGSGEDAVRALEQVVRLQPDDTESWSRLATGYETHRQFEKALVCLNRAVTLAPENVGFLNSRGLILHELEDLYAAEASYMMALSLAPCNAVVCNNLGNIYKSRRMMSEAIAWYDRAIAVEPDNATIIFNRSLAYLALGMFQKGWPGYERRFDMIPPVVLAHREIPLWQGEPLKGRRLLIQAEQVYGDTFMFARFAPMAAAFGGPVVFECQDRGVLKALCSLEQAMESLVVRGEPLPEVDLRVPLLSLPGIFGITVENIPYGGGYLEADPARVAEWKDRLAGTGDALSVGLVWGGRKAPLNADRSMRLNMLEPLFAVPGVRFFSLQLGEDAQQIEPYRNVVADVSPYLTDFGETAAAISCLDVIVTIDTAVAHLAGALGTPVWVMLKYSPDWRWMFKRNDSPWYDSARLFRQQSPGDWASVVAAVSAELEIVMSSKK